MARTDPLAQLRALNELLARVGGTDSERAEHARRALDFFDREQAERPSASAVGACAERLAELHLATAERDVAYAHWRVPLMEDFSPLWIRQAIVAEMQKLAGSREALLLVTGLREAVCPAGSYLTRSREREYARVRGWIDELACAWATRGSRLQVVVV